VDHAPGAEESANRLGTFGGRASVR